MRNYAKLGCGIALGLAAALACRSSLGALDGSYLNKVTMDWPTPHLAWAKPLAQGPVKALFIVPRAFAAREVVELAQRMDLDFKAVTMFHTECLAPDGDEGAYLLSGQSPAEKERELVDALGGRYDVIVLANASMRFLPLEAQYLIIRHAAEGGGILFTYDTEVPYQKLLKQPLPDECARIVDGIGWQGLPATVRAAAPEKVVRAYSFGKGRVVKLAYPVGSPTYWGGMGLTAMENWSESWWSAYETNMALVQRALLWAAGRAPRATASLEPKTTPWDAGDVLAKGLALQISSKELHQVTLSLRWRLDDNTVLEEQEQPVALNRTAAGHPDTGWAEVTFKPKHCPVGAMHLDAIVRSDKGVESIATWTLPVQGALAGASVATDREAYEADQPVRVTVKGIANPAHRPLTLRVRLMDMPYRQVWQQCDAALAADQAEWTGELAAAADWPTPAGLLQCELWDGRQLQARLMKYVFFPRHRRPLYTAYEWGGVPAILAPMYAQQMVEGLGWHFGLGFPGANGENARFMALFNQRMVTYMTRLGLGADDKGRTQQNVWGITDQEKASIQEDQSFYNPKVQALWKKCIDQSIVNLPLYDPLVYSLGDENGFAYEAGYSPSDEKAFRNFLRKRYGQIENLNREWQTAFADFDSVKHYTLHEMQKEKRYAAWYDHRCFMEQEYADLHHFIADYIRSKDPNAKVGPEGSEPGNLEETIKGLEFWGPYSDPVTDEVLRSVGGDRLRTLWWGGYVSSHGGRDVYPTPLWRPLLLGTVNGSAWYVAGNFVEGMLAADFSYADYMKQLAPHLDRLNRGIGTLLVDQPLKSDGIAVLWSHASETVPIMVSDPFGPHESARVGGEGPDLWLAFGPHEGASLFTAFCHRHGLQFDFVTSSMVERGALKPYKFLFLPGAAALSEAEARCIAEFVRDGGIVVADLKPGVLSGHCRALDRSSLAELFDFPNLRADAPLVFEPLKVEQTIRAKHLTFRAQKVWQEKPAQGGVSPALTSHVVGKGLAVLLNFALSSAADTADPSTPLDGLLLNLLALAEIQPMVTVQGVDDALPNEFEQEWTTMVSIPGAASESLVLSLRQKGDCVTLALLANKRDEGKTVTITLPEAMFAYRADGGFLAQGRQISLKLDLPFQVLCLFPKEQAAPRLATDAGAAIQAGQVLVFDAAGLNRDTVYRIEVLDPKGLAITPRLQIVPGSSFAARPALSVPFAWSDVAGKYTIVLTDVRTGLQGRREVEVSAAGLPAKSGGAAVLPAPAPMVAEKPAPLAAALPFDSLCTAGCRPHVEETLSDEKSRGNDVKRDKVGVSLTTAAIGYSGIFHSGTGELLKDKYGDLGFSLSLCGPWGGGSMWNWSGENFMSADIQDGARKLPMMGYRLGGAAVLEEQPRAMAQMRWPLVAGGKGPGATLTALQLPDEPKWVFLRLDLDSASAWWATVGFVTYPFITLGPRERERWYATTSKTAACLDKTAIIPTDNYALAFFNKFAQERAATLLVYNPEQFKSITVAGPYGIEVRFSPRAGQRSLTFALGCRLDEPADAVVREFQRETARRVYELLQRTDWTPHISFDASDRLAKEVTEWLRNDGTPDTQPPWRAIMDRYEAARQTASPAAVIASREEMAGFKQEWLRQALNRYL